MRKFQNKITEAGLQKNKLPKTIASLVKEFEEAENEVKQLKSDLESMDEDDEEKADLINEIAEYEQLLETTDNKIVAKLDDYVAKKPYYEAKFQHMRDVAAAKKSGQTAPPAPTKASVSAGTTASANTSTQYVQPQPIYTPPPPANEPEKVEEKKKEGTNWLLWGALGIAGIFLGVNFYKNRQ
jgi:predicted RNase H-like nuclease (RuvC/YqgF family)